MASIPSFDPEIAESDVAAALKTTSLQHIKKKLDESEAIRLKTIAWIAAGNSISIVAAGASADAECSGIANSVTRPRVMAIDDISGNRFGNLVVIRRTKDRSIQHYWHVKCDCGKTDCVEKIKLTKGIITACKECRSKKGKEIQRVVGIGLHKKKKEGYDLVGVRFGRLLAKQISSKKLGAARLWKCDCDCGEEELVKTANLVSGKITECKACRSKNEKAKKAQR